MKKALIFFWANLTSSCTKKRSQLPLMTLNNKRSLRNHFTIWFPLFPLFGASLTCVREIAASDSVPVLHNFAFIFNELCWYFQSAIEREIDCKNFPVFCTRHLQGWIALETELRCIFLPCVCSLNYWQLKETSKLETSNTFWNRRKCEQTIEKTQEKCSNLLS